MALGLIHLLAFTLLVGGYARSKSPDGDYVLRGFGWGCVAFAWIVSGIVLAAQAVA